MSFGCPAAKESIICDHLFTAYGSLLVVDFPAQISIHVLLFFYLVCGNCGRDSEGSCSDNVFYPAARKAKAQLLHKLRVYSINEGLIWCGFRANIMDINSWSLLLVNFMDLAGVFLVFCFGCW